MTRPKCQMGPFRLMNLPTLKTKGEGEAAGAGKIQVWWSRFNIWYVPDWHLMGQGEVETRSPCKVKSSPNHQQSPKGHFWGFWKIFPEGIFALI